jgi:hypothetical protein
VILVIVDVADVVLGELLEEGGGGGELVDPPVLDVAAHNLHLNAKWCVLVTSGAHRCSRGAGSQRMRHWRRGSPVPGVERWRIVDNVVGGVGRGGA